MLEERDDSKPDVLDRVCGRTGFGLDECEFFGECSKERLDLGSSVGVVLDDICGALFAIGLAADPDCLESVERFVACFRARESDGGKGWEQGGSDFFERV